MKSFRQIAENKKKCVIRGLAGEEEPIVQLCRGIIVITEKSVQETWKGPVLSKKYVNVSNTVESEHVSAVPKHDT